MGKVLKKAIIVIIVILAIGGIYKGGINVRAIYTTVLNGGSVKDYDEYYKAVEKNIKNYESDFTINVNRYDENKYDIDVISEVVDNNQQLAGICLNGTYTVTTLGTITEIIFNVNYSHNREELIARDKVLKDKVKDVVKSTINGSMRDYEKERVLHDYVINNCKYDMRYYSDDMPYESYTAYGVLVNGVGVCQGYAVAMQMLLEEAGIKSTIIIGDALDYNTNEYLPHAWNLVKLDEEYYHLDTTWDDPVTTDKKDNLSYSYFNINDKNMEEDHKWDTDKYPKCTSDKYNFNNLNIVEKDSNGNNIRIVSTNNELTPYLQSDMIEMKTEVTYKIKDFNENLDELKSIVESVYEDLGRSGKYSFSYQLDEKTKIGYVTFYLQ